jgi:hypothetical protein
MISPQALLVEPSATSAAARLVPANRKFNAYLLIDPQILQCPRLQTELNKLPGMHAATETFAHHQSEGFRPPSSRGGPKLYVQYNPCWSKIHDETCMHKNSQVSSNDRRPAKKCGNPFLKGCYISGRLQPLSHKKLESLTFKLSGQISDSRVSSSLGLLQQGV